MHMPQKLLYVLPEVAFVVDPIPTKKPHTFAIRSFRQINGDFLDENEFISHNLSKLMDKLDKEQYQLVLPDYLFTNTIVNINEQDEKAAVSQAKAKLLPDLGITAEEYYVTLSVVTQHRGVSKVQLSALEKSLIKPLTVAAQEHGVGISEVVPLSWTLKSAISLEPSISIVQLGESAYLALHYIGVDQTMQSLTTEVGNLAETAKTLKGSEASIQTVYLLSSPEVEKTLKAQLEGVLPVQQLTDKKASDQDIPSYVRQAIEIGLKTLSIEEYQLPKFALNLEAGTASHSVVATPIVLGEDLPQEDAAEKKSLLATATKATEEPKDSGEQADETVGLPAKPSVFAAMLPTPVLSNAVAESVDSLVAASDEPVTTQIEDLLEQSSELSSTDGKRTDFPSGSDDDDDDDDDDDEDDATEKPIVLTKSVEPISKSDSASQAESTTNQMRVTTMQSAFSPKDISQEESDSQRDMQTDGGDLGKSDTDQDTGSKSRDSVEKIDKSDAAKQRVAAAEGKTSSSQERQTSVDLAQFTPVGRDHMSLDTHTERDHVASSNAKMIVKDNPGISGMLKTFFIVVVTAVITIGIGIGVGLAYLQYSQKTQPVAQKAEEAPAPTTAPSPTPTPLPAIDRSRMKALVVNATTIAGHAGKVASLLEEAGYGTVKAANAKGEYEPGVYLLASEKMATLSAVVNKDTKLTLTLDKNKKTEDPTDTYDIVVVLAE